MISVLKNLPFKSRKQLQYIVDIGKRNYCTLTDIYSPDLDVFSCSVQYTGIDLRGSLYKFSPRYKSSNLRRDIFINKPTNSQIDIEKRELIHLLVNFIKGSHLIEEKLIELKQGGFGSTTETNNLLITLFQLDPLTAENTYNWIAFHGGNYYIQSNISYEENRRKEIERFNKHNKRLLEDQKRKAERIRLRNIKLEKFNKRRYEAHQVYKNIQAKLGQLTDIKLIILFNKVIMSKSILKDRPEYHKYMGAFREEFIKRKLKQIPINTKNEHLHNIKRYSL